VERNAHRAEQQRVQQRAEQAVAERLEARELVRRNMRPTLDTMAATTLAQISELDRSRSDDVAFRLIQTAELAPETFAPEIIEHLFTLIESDEYGLIDPCLAALARLPVDKTRLCNTALRVLGRFSARDSAAAIIEEHSGLADPALVSEALPELIHLANPAPLRFGLGERRLLLPGPLKAAYRLHAAAVKNGLKGLLEKKDANSVRIAARGLEALAEEDSSLDTLLMPELAAKLARAKWLIQGRKEEIEDAVHDVRGALTRAFRASPQECDAMIASYLNGATPEGADELHHVYREVLWNVKHPDEEVKITDAHRLAFRRLVTAAIQTKNEEVAKTAQRVFQGAPYGLTPLAGAEIDLLLGSAALVAVKLKEIENTKNDEFAKGFFGGLEWMNRRSALSSLENSFVDWACTAAGRYGVESVRKVLSVLQGLPEDSDSLRAAIVGHFDEMMVTTETLALCLPYFYSALVGPSQVVRSSAARALGEMRRQALENLPDLVFEAFTALLYDPFVIVHRAAVKALERFQLPPKFDPAAERALRDWIAIYAAKANQDSSAGKFLMETIDLYAHRYANEEDRAGRLGTQLIGIMATLEPSIVVDELRYSRRSYLTNPAYPRLLFKLMDDDRAMSIYHEELIEQLDRLPKQALYRERASALALGKKLSKQYGQILGVLVEALTAAGAWKEAGELTAAAYADIPDTTSAKAHRLHAALYMIACSYESAISCAQLDQLEGLAKRWKAILSEIENDRSANEARRDPFYGVLRPH
jgi:hypothetical protein